MIKHPWYNIFLLGFFGGCEPKGKKLETGNWKLETGNRRLETGDWKPETGNWKLETGSRRLETGTHASGRWLGSLPKAARRAT